MEWKNAYYEKPIKNGTYLVTVMRNQGFIDAKPTVSIAYFEDGEWTCNIDEVVGWNELPQPMKIDKPDLNCSILSQMNKRADQFNDNDKQDWKAFIKSADLQYSLLSIIENDDAFNVLKEKFMKLYSNNI